MADGRQSDPSDTSDPTSCAPRRSCARRDRRDSSSVTDRMPAAIGQEAWTFPGQSAGTRLRPLTEPRVEWEIPTVGPCCQPPSARCGTNPVLRMRPHGCGGTGCSSVSWSRLRCWSSLCAPTSNWPAVALGLALGLVGHAAVAPHPPAGDGDPRLRHLDRPVTSPRCSADVRSVGLYTSVYVLLLPYALLRWGSGAEVDHRACRSSWWLMPSASPRTTRRGRGRRSKCVRRVPRRLGALVRFQASYQANEKRPDQAHRARAAGPRAPRHRRTPRLGHRASAPRPVESSRPLTPTPPSTALRVIEEEAVASAHRDAADGRRPAGRRGGGAGTRSTWSRTSLDSPPPSATHHR